MKTNKFENTIRQKLESIEPDFQEADWTKMQNFMQVHTPPTFWQQYGSWLGYAAAASVTTVMAFMYVTQLSKTNGLVSDVQKLQGQIEVIKNAPVTAQKTDTIYIVQKETSKGQFQNIQQQTIASENEEIVNDEIIESPTKLRNKDLAEKNRSESFQNTEDRSIAGKTNLPEAETKIDHKNRAIVSEPVDNESLRLELADEVSGKTDKNYAENSGSYNNGGIKNSNAVSANNGNENALTSASVSFAKTLNDFNQLKELKAVRPDNGARIPYQMNYALSNRLSSRQVRKVLLAQNSLAVKPVVTDKKVEKVTKAENTIPRLNIKAPYRFGAGYQFEGSNQVKNITGEVLVSKKFSISTGVSWLKIKPMEFITEKIFRERNKKDFKKSHPDEVPMAFEILNINVKPTLVQIPLTLAFRNELGNNINYFVGAGTNVTVKGREQFSFDCRLPNPKHEFLAKSFERKLDVPVINSLNISAGIEKTWHPIVIQVEGYLYSYFKPISPESQRTGPGVKVKLLYQIGGKM